MVKALHDSILEDGISFTAYFNGRLLSGEDLARDQAGNREARRRIGQGLGEGVAFGLEVFETPGQSTRTSPMLTVRPGVAINRQGQVLALRSPVELNLVRAVSAATSTASTLFKDCDQAQPGVSVVGEGVYVLTMACAQGGQGRAPVSGLGNTAVSCNVRSMVEGLQFRLVQPLVNPLVLADLAHLRNRVAGAALGLVDRQIAYRDPMGPPMNAYGLVDGLRAGGAVTDCDVPLGLLHWTASEGITFVDMWSVRRRPTRRGEDARWTALFGDRVESEAEATFLQFQEHIDDIADSGEDASAIAAVDRFDYLPPLGMLPLQLGSRPGFDPQRFFGPDRMSRDIAHTDGALLRGLLRESFAHDPINLSTPGRVQLYLVFDNVQAAAAGQAVTPMLVFASRELPYRGVARHGFGRWEQSRFAPRVI
jgi:hypothetical protein